MVSFVASIKKQSILVHLKILLSSKSSCFFDSNFEKLWCKKKTSKISIHKRCSPHFGQTAPGFFQHPVGFSTKNNRPPRIHCRSPHPLGLRNCTRYCGAPLRGARTYGAGRWRLLRKISALEWPRVPSWERIHIFWIYSPPRMQSSQMKV